MQIKHELGLIGKRLLATKSEEAERIVDDFIDRVRGLRAKISTVTQILEDTGLHVKSVSLSASDSSSGPEFQIVFFHDELNHSLPDFYEVEDRLVNTLRQIGSSTYPVLGRTYLSTRKE